MITATDILLGLDIWGFLSLFWYFILFDLTRYTISFFAVLFSTVFDRRQFHHGYYGPISVLLVGHNEGESLTRTVMSLRDQTTKALEIVVVDDGSTDETPAIGRRLARQGLIDTFVANPLRGGKASALNIGLSRCRHPVVVTADVDTSFDRDAIERIVAPFSDPEVGAVSGNLAVRNPEVSLISAFQAIQYFVAISLGRRFTSAMDILMIVSGAFGAFRREAIVAVGGWDVGPGDDSNLTTKIRRSGWRVRFAHDAWAMTDVPTTLSAFVRQRTRWNRSVVRNRMRKFSSVFNPLNANFSFLDLLGACNVLFFQVILSITFFIYIFYLFYFFGVDALYVIFMVTIIYVAQDIVQFFVICILYHERRVVHLFPFVFGLSVFQSYFLRFVRTKAYLDELIFRRSYRDPFYPSKVRNAVEKF